MMEYPKILPEKSIFINGTAFHIDLKNRSLVQSFVGANTIPLDELKDEGAYYSLVLNSENNELFRAWQKTGQDESHLIKVLLPVGLFQDAFWKDQSAIREMNRVSGQMANPLWVVDEKLHQRIAGKLPVISIAGDEFIIDLRLDELRRIDHLKFTQIPLSSMALNAEGDRFLLLYDRDKKEEFLLQPNTVSLPPQVALMSIPYELDLDPVGYSLKMGQHPVALLDKFPIQEKLMAKEEPLAQTRIPQLLAENQKKAKEKSDHLGKKPSKHLKKGKGL